MYYCVIWGVLVVENIIHVFSLASGGSGVQARLRGDGSSLLHMLLAQQFDWGCSIQDGFFDMSGGLGLAISWEPCFISTRHLFLSRWSLINQESRASLFTGHQLLISKLAFGSSLKHGSEEGHQEVVGTSYSGKEKESLVLTPTNGI